MDGQGSGQIQPITLWLTDRTRYATGTGRCARQRYLTNHFGPTGYGIVHRSDSLPLATGSYVHAGLEQLFQYVKAHDALPPPAAIRDAIAAATGAYERRVESRGFRGLLASESTERVIAEQQTLIAGLLLAVCRRILPWIHETYQILEVETESIYVLDCTCGLTSAVLDARQHDARGCQGIGQMLRQDCIAQHRSSGNLAYFEAKTTGWAGENWAPQWETKPQLAIGTLGVQERYGREITESFILGLYKGSRKKVEDVFEGTWYRQDSPLCYGYKRPGNPPLATDDWKPAYAWTDEATGQKKRVSRDYQKAPISELLDSDWPIWQQARALDPTITPSEVWVNQLPPSVVENQVFLVGPLNRQDEQIQTLKRQVVGEERHWQQILWRLYELQQQGHGWASDEFQAQLDYLVPASWECRRFGLRHECEMLPICLKQQGWQDPLANGFVPRRPHHQPELLQGISRGLLPEEADEAEEDE